MEPHPHRRKLHRFNHVAQSRFLTFSCFRRLPLLNNDKIRELFLSKLAPVCAAHHLRLLAWVIMPEHVHLVVFPDQTPDIAKFSHALKRPFAEAVLRRWKQLNAPILNRLTHGSGHRFWQTGGGYDRNLIHRHEVLDKIQYIHENPVRRNLATTPTQYPWSSAQWYANHPNPKLSCSPLPF